LGSFLYDKDNYVGNPKFKSGSSKIPETQHVIASDFITEELTIEGKKQTYRFKIVDTPGLLESAKKDFEHMVQVLKELHHLGKIDAVIIPSRMDQKIDIPFIESVEFYCNFFRGCLGSNLVLVLSNVLTDEMSVERRKLANVDVNQCCIQVQSQVKEIANLFELPPIFTIDAFPLKSIATEYQTACKARLSILQQIAQMPPVETRGMLFRKTKEIVADDKIKIANLEGAIKGLLDHMETLKETEKQYATDRKKKVDEIENTKNELSELKLQVKELIDGEELVRSWSCDKGWTIAGLYHEESFFLESPVDISRFSQSTPDTFTWTIEKKTDRTFAGKITGNWFRGVQAQVWLYANKRDLHKSVVDQFNIAIPTTEKALKILELEEAELEKKRKTMSDKINVKVEVIESNQKRITKLKEVYIPLEEAILQLESLKDLYLTK